MTTSPVTPCTPTACPSWLASRRTRSAPAVRPLFAPGARSRSCRRRQCCSKSRSAGRSPASAGQRRPRGGPGARTRRRARRREVRRPCWRARCWSISSSSHVAALRRASLAGSWRRDRGPYPSGLTWLVAHPLAVFRADSSALLQHLRSHGARCGGARCWRRSSARSSSRQIGAGARRSTRGQQAGAGNRRGAERQRGPPRRWPTTAKVARGCPPLRAGGASTAATAIVIAAAPSGRVRCRPASGSRGTVSPASPSSSAPSRSSARSCAMLGSLAAAPRHRVRPSLHRQRGRICRPGIAVIYCPGETLDQCSKTMGPTNPRGVVLE